MEQGKQKCVVLWIKNDKKNQHPIWSIHIYCSGLIKWRPASLDINKKTLEGKSTLGETGESRDTEKERVNFSEHLMGKFIEAVTVQTQWYTCKLTASSQTFKIQGFSQSFLCWRTFSPIFNILYLSVVDRSDSSHHSTVTGSWRT